LTKKLLLSKILVKNHQTQTFTFFSFLLIMWRGFSNSYLSIVFFSLLIVKRQSIILFCFFPMILETLPNWWAWFIYMHLRELSLSLSQRLQDKKKKNAKIYIVINHPIYTTLVYIIILSSVKIMLSICYFVDIRTTIIINI